MLMFFSVLFFYCSIISFCLNRKHLLSLLLGLEFIALSLYFYLFYFLLYYDFEFFFLMVFLTFSVCEGSLGLSILVCMVRSHGNDYFNTFNVLW